MDEEVHYWSPQLSFRVELDEQNPNQSVVFGLIGPKPEVWTMFMFVYFTIGVLGFFISSYGYAKWSLGEFSNMVLAFPIAIVFMLTAYGVGKYGEQLAKNQSEMLKQFVREVIFFENDI